MRFLILFVLVFIVACKKQEDKVPDYIKVDKYAGLEKGRFIIYQAIEINHTPATSTTVISDTFRYELKVVIEDTLTDDLGRISWKYLRYKRQNAQENWALSDVWTTLLAAENLEIVEENQRIIKLKSPIKNSTAWNENIYNNLGESVVSYEKINASFSLNSLSFDSTVTVNQGEERNLISFVKKQEVYAKGVGMVYKYFKDLKIANFDTLNIKSGKELYLYPKLVGFQ
jgi:hypothetical protein